MAWCCLALFIPVTCSTYRTKEGRLAKLRSRRAGATGPLPALPLGPSPGEALPRPSEGPARVSFDSLAVRCRWGYLVCSSWLPLTVQLWGEVGLVGMEGPSLNRLQSGLWLVGVLGHGSSGATALDRSMP